MANCSSLLRRCRPQVSVEATWRQGGARGIIGRKEYVVKNWKICATVTVAAVALLTGCTSQDTPQTPQPSPPSRTSVITTTAPSTPPSFYSFVYEADPEREARISAVTREFGLLVLQESKKNGRSAWGVFDTFCSIKGQTNGKWTSKGHTPVVGEVCSTQHTPHYGAPDAQIGATYEVLPDGKYDFVRATANATPDCRVETDHSIRDGVRSVSTTKTTVGKVSTEMKFESTSTAATSAEARAIDEKVVVCIKNTRP